MTGGSFATAINCIDGRAQEPVIKLMKQRFGVDFVDMVTEPGVDGKLATGDYVVEALKQKVMISTGKHHSKAIAVVGHADCAGNPVSKDEHFNHIKKATEMVEVWGLNLPIIGVFVNEDLKIEQVVG